MTICKSLLKTGIALIVTGFQIAAYASAVETLVMPGAVSAAHADIETECSECHAAFSKTLQRDLCLSCHEHKSVLEDQASGSGFHGRFEPARDVECSNCHTEHKGREADIMGLDRESFDHAFTDFPLAGAHAAVACDDCHSEQRVYRDTPSNCFACHRQDDAHAGRLGEDCAACHTENKWQEATFDHDEDSDFPLAGAHQKVDCALCHSNQVYKGIPTDCYSCHQINDYHQGDYGRDCKQCHRTDEWKSTTFDHAKASEFALQGRHRNISCGSCHRGSLFDEPLRKECVSCHLVDDVHQGGNGADCASCHGSEKWTGSTFDHQSNTHFPLTGAHQDVQCQACHTTQAATMKLDTACFSCHQINDVHRGDLGEDCSRCHQVTAWAEDVRFDHDLSSFPLIGMHAVAPCEACHLSARFGGAPSRCVDCHRQDDPHRASLGEECGTCHNPNDWLLWQFDHDASTRFVLEGAHQDVACQNCHKPAHDYSAKLDADCISCHRKDDVHAGQFGRTCARCHDTRSFKNKATLQ
jgi:hypothetical protein